jgi:hypothetical protein
VLELLPFDGDVVVADQAHRVVAPPYDALAPAARAALAATDPDSYLGALPPGTAADAEQLDAALARSRAHLDRLVAAGRYRPIGGPAVGVLALGSGVDRASAIVGDVPVAAFAALAGDDGSRAGGPAAPPRPFAADDGLVRPHELVDEGRVAQLARYLEVVGVASSPVALTQRPHAEVTAATAAVVERPPDLAYRADDGVDVALWCVTDPAVRARLVAAVAAAGPAFLADGHHRGAAAARHAAALGAGRHDPAGRVFCAVLPADHLRVHAFHRRLDGALAADTSDEVPRPARSADGRRRGCHRPRRPPGTYGAAPRHADRRRPVVGSRRHRPRPGRRPRRGVGRRPRRPRPAAAPATHGRAERPGHAGGGAARPRRAGGTRRDRPGAPPSGPRGGPGYRCRRPFAARRRPPTSPRSCGRGWSSPRAGWPRTPTTPATAAHRPTLRPVDAVADLDRTLREQGHRSTRPRRAVWRVLAGADAHLTVEQVAAP